MQRPFDYWASGEGMANLTPPGLRFPEGERFMREFTDTLFGQDVIDFGCGDGRLAAYFSKKRYVGVDICRKVIEQARSANHGYDFTLIDGKRPIDWGHALFAHNVMMHVPDEELSATLGRFRQRRILIGEVLGHNWRRDTGNPPVFNREIEDYMRAFEPHGYKLEKCHFKKLEFWKASDFAVMEFHKIA